MRNDVCRLNLEDLIAFINKQNDLGNLKKLNPSISRIYDEDYQGNGKNNEQIKQDKSGLIHLIKHKIRLAETIINENKDEESSKGVQFIDLTKKYLHDGVYNKIIDDSFEIIRHQNYDIPWITNLNPNVLRTSRSYQTLVDSLAYYLDPDHTKDVPNEIYLMALKIWQLELVVIINQTNDDADSINIKESKQNRIIENGIVKIICHLLLRSNDDEIIYQALFLACLILDGGNLEGQRQFHKNLSEMCKKGVLKKIEYKLQSTFDKISKLMNFKNKNSLDNILNPENADEDYVEYDCCIYWTSQDGSDLNLSKNILLKI